MRCHDFGSGLEVRRSQYVDIGKENDDAMGQNSCQPEGLQPESAAHRSVEQGPRLRGCDRRGACESRGFGAPSVALRGRIQAQNAWNLLRPPRDATLLVLRIHKVFAAPGALPSPILAATHTCFMLLGTLWQSAANRACGAAGPVAGNHAPSLGKYRDRCIESCVQNYSMHPAPAACQHPTSRRVIGRHGLVLA